MKNNSTRFNDEIFKLLNSLIEPYRTKALKNYKKNPQVWGNGIPTLRDAVNSFGWANSPEGSEYWSDFYESIIVVYAYDNNLV